MTSTPTPESNRLFRREALEAQQPKLLGTIVLTPRLSLWWLSFSAAALAALLLAFLYFGSYTRRTNVTGQLVPSAGVIRVLTPQNGVVLEKRVSEGQLVNKGDLLFVLTSDRVGLTSRELQADVSQQINERKGSMQGEIARNRMVEQQENAQIARRLASLHAEAETIVRQTEQQRQRVALAEDARKRYQGLADQDYIAREQLVQKELELSEQQSRLQALLRDALSNQREQAAAERELEMTKTRYANLNAQLQRTISSASQELTEVEGRRRVVITAPEGGRATLVTGDVGQAIDATQPLVTLVPAESKIEAKLYAPSRTIGFVRAGDRVLLRYQAYPYQKFGLHEGTVKEVSNVAVSNLQLAGFALPELTPGEPVYSISVVLKAQTLKVYGEDRQLQVGMRLDADILQENRRLYEWMLEPLYSISGKLER